MLQNIITSNNQFGNLIIHSTKLIKAPCLIIRENTLVCLYFSQNKSLTKNITAMCFHNSESYHNVLHTGKSHSTYKLEITDSLQKVSVKKMV